MLEKDAEKYFNEKTMKYKRKKKTKKYIRNSENNKIHKK